MTEARKKALENRAISGTIEKAWVVKGDGGECLGAFSNEALAGALAEARTGNNGVFASREEIGIWLNDGTFVVISDAVLRGNAKAADTEVVQSGLDRIPRRIRDYMSSCGSINA